MYHYPVETSCTCWAIRLTDVLDYNGIIITLGKESPSIKANRFIEWFTYCDER
ncbi:MAG: hypothetical protein PHI32_00315 [Dysgonamonadaceae bacterium]|nr:hypothetical protein [Dysgonamonadaceae bacterium]MDD4727186.1 hypothetical protein [Dysgonamonadaceae bacterium]